MLLNCLCLIGMTQVLELTAWTPFSPDFATESSVTITYWVTFIVAPLKSCSWDWVLTPSLKILHHRLGLK